MEREGAMLMRVISGSAKGHKLFSPVGKQTRPTSDFVKENIFNIIGDAIVGTNFLDVFAGSGAVGIEALSRRARTVTFVDSSQKAVELIKRNLDKTGLKQNAVVIKAEAVAAIKKLSGQTFDIIFMDPPYFEDFVDKTLNAIVEADILADDGFIVLEAAKSEDVNGVDGLKVFKEKEYSGTKLIFIEKAESV